MSKKFDCSESYMLSVFHVFLVSPIKEKNFDTFFKIYCSAKEDNVCFDYAMMRYVAKEVFAKDE